VKVGDLVIKKMSYCKKTTPPDMVETISKLYGIVIDVQGGNYVKIAWSDNYGTYWNCPESIEVVSES